MADCPECQIIILNYSEIPVAAGGVVWKSQAIEALYDTDFVRDKIRKHPEIHETVLQVGRDVLERERQNMAALDGLIRMLSS